MQLKNITVRNLSSLVNFENDDGFKKRNLIFGTNGSGKSTLVELLYLLDNYMRYPDIETKEKGEELRTFFRQRISKECDDGHIDVCLKFKPQKEFRLRYTHKTDAIEISRDHWTPIKVFNEQYTYRTLGATFQLDLTSKGITIGEPNIKLENAKTTKKEVSSKLQAKLSEARVIAKNTQEEFFEVSKSSPGVGSVISEDNLLADSCDFVSDNSLVKRRKALGYTKPEVSELSLLDENACKVDLESRSVEEQFNESYSAAPIFDDETTALLKSYTDFVSSGIEIFKDSKNKICPFCRRDWPNAQTIINQYKLYLESDFNKRRSSIKKLRGVFRDYKQSVEKKSIEANKIYSFVNAEAEKYNVDISTWEALEYDEELHAKITRKIDQKHKNMHESISIIDDIRLLQDKNLGVIKNNNKLIRLLLKERDSISVRRREINKKLAEHFTRKMWEDNSALRATVEDCRKSIEDCDRIISKIENESRAEDTIRVVFNRLLEFIGLNEYFLDENKKLNLNLDKPYDISAEGKRISSAQKKILSLCYFFAEIISECSSVQDLTEYVLFFDDPVDSADYIYFYSITSIIEKAGKIFSRILDDEVKFGQLFVFTHNSLLYDRLNSSGWGKDFCKAMKKIDGVTKIFQAEKTINNYSEYIAVICRYYNSPQKNRSEMIFIGNVIRRVLEILNSFDTLESPQFQSTLDDMGKTRLAVLVNYLSHESFSKVLNPLSEPEDMRLACKELLEVIKECHPRQYETIKTKHHLNL